MAPLSGGFKRHIETHGGNPGAESGAGIDVAEIEAGGGVQCGIGPAASGFDAGLGDLPLRARDLQVRMIIEGGEGKHFEIPRRRCGGGIAGEILVQKTSQAGILQGAAFQGDGGLLRRNRPRLEMSAAGRQSAGKQRQTNSISVFSQRGFQKYPGQGYCFSKTRTLKLFAGPLRWPTER